MNFTGKFHYEGGVAAILTGLLLFIAHLFNFIDGLEQGTVLGQSMVFMAHISAVFAIYRNIHCHKIQSAKGEMELRQDIKGNLETRKIYRRSRRNRKTRYRQARFLNRTSSKKEGWLPPSIQSRLDNTFRWIDTLLRIASKSNTSYRSGKI